MQRHVIEFKVGGDTVVFAAGSVLSALPPAMQPGDRVRQALHRLLADREQMQRLRFFLGRERLVPEAALYHQLGDPEVAETVSRQVASGMLRALVMPSFSGGGAPAISVRNPAGETPQKPMGQWTLTDKLAEVIRRTARRVDGAAVNTLLGLLSSENMSLMAVMTGANGAPAVLLADAVRLGIAWHYGGPAGIDALKDMAEGFAMVSSARTPRGLDEAAAYLARATGAIGISGFIAVLNRGRMNTAADENLDRPWQPKAALKSALAAVPKPKAPEPPKPSSLLDEVKTLAEDAAEKYGGDIAKQAVQEAEDVAQKVADGKEDELLDEAKTLAQAEAEKYGGDAVKKAEDVAQKVADGKTDELIDEAKKAAEDEAEKYGGDEAKAAVQKAEDAAQKIADGKGGEVLDEARQAAEDAAEKYGDEARQKAQDAVQDAKNEAEKAVEDARQQAQDAAQKAEDEAKQAVSNAEDKAKEEAGKAADAAQQAADEAKQKAQDAAQKAEDEAKQAVSDAEDKAKEKAGQAADAARQAAEDAKDAAGNAASAAQDAASSAEQTAEDALGNAFKNPFG